MRILTAIVFALTLASVAVAQTTTKVHPLTAQQIDALLGHLYDHKLISSGNNRPSVRLDENHLGDLCILRHSGVPLAEIRDHFHWSPDELQQRLHTLESEGLLKLDHGAYRPVLAVITESDARQYFKVSPQIIDEAAGAITHMLPKLKAQSEAIPGLRRIPFPDLSFFLLSDVLLDNWQIHNVEDGMFGKPRTEHAGKQYYYSIQEKASPAIESFGIYGNNQASFGEVWVGLYGNTRDSENNLATMSSKQIAEKCGLESTVDAEPLKQALLLEYAQAFPNLERLQPAHKQCFQTLGLITASSPSVPMLTEPDIQALSELSKKFTPKLLSLLQHEQPRLMETYQKSPYAREISFQEFLMWWYHFFYTAVTNELAARGSVVLPPAGTTTYLWREQH